VGAHERPYYLSMRITERSNPITERIDAVSSAEMVSLIGAAEREIFGSSWGQGLFERNFLGRVADLRGHIKEVLSRSDGRLIISGAGTSGRLALHAAAGIDQVVGLMAGGMDAFFRAREGVEDSPQAGARDLDAALNGSGRFVYIGISCGLSAAYVAGGVARALERNGTVGVIGFNPTEQANRRPLPGLATSFHGLACRLEEGEGFLLNPIVGPEPITGSTRMKGGSATRILLDLLLRSGPVQQQLVAFQKLQDLVFKHADLTQAIEAAATTLAEDGDIAYLADAHEGLMAILDASECPPTFGSQPHHVRVFTEDRFADLLPGFNMQGSRLSDLAALSQPPQALFPVCYTPRLGWPPGFAGASLHLPLPVADFIAALPEAERATHRSMALKWLLNSFSTCSFIRAGKVYGNTMVDLRISNLKLWDRAVRIVTELGRVACGEAEAVLVRTVTGATGKEAPQRALLVTLASQRERVVPTAILAAHYGITPDEARAILRSQPLLKQNLAVGNDF